MDHLFNLNSILNHYYFDELKIICYSNLVIFEFIIYYLLICLNNLFHFTIIIIKILTSFLNTFILIIDIAHF
jgi:hypothetical protein